MKHNFTELIEKDSILGRRVYTTDKINEPRGVSHVFCFKHDSGLSLRDILSVSESELNSSLGSEAQILSG